MQVRLKYGTDYKEVFFPKNTKVTVLSAGQKEPVADMAEALRSALYKPLGTLPLRKRPAPYSVAIVVPDETRPVPLKELLPVLIEHLLLVYPALLPKNITIVVGGGLHPPADEGQLERILPKNKKHCQVVAHDAEHSPVQCFGHTSGGTPVEVNEAVGKADLKIVIGQVDPHQFMGFTGGAKGIIIGCGSKKTIEHNHSMMAAPQARVGNILDNPARLDLNEAGEMVGVVLAVNVVLDAQRNLVCLVAGDPVECLYKGAEAAAEVYGVRIKKQFDMVVASCGGYPKDICLYQAQKGLNQASMAAKPGGKILLLAACSKGVGDEHYYSYVSQFSCAYAQLKEFQEKGFRMGAHKAFLFSRTLTNFDVGIVSDLDATTLKHCHLQKVFLQETIDKWLAKAPKSEVAVIPHANTMYFVT